MATTDTERIHTKSKHLTMEDRESLYQCLKRGLNLTDTAKYLHCDISTVKYEIDRNKTLKVSGLSKNKCGHKLKCNVHSICGNSKCTRQCKSCIKSSINCNDLCSDFDLKPHCRKLKHICGVCNGCDMFADCKLNKYIYNPTESQKTYEGNLSKAHKGERIRNGELEKFTNFLLPLIKKNLSLQAIKSQCPNEFPYSIQTVYNWINKGILKGVDNILLPRKVRYKPRKLKNNSISNDRSYLVNRTYDCFMQYITDYPYNEVVELDSVEGNEHKSFIMTLLFRKSNFMMAFKLKDHTSQSIVETFNKIKDIIGDKLFKDHFKCILTDRGSEFSSPELVEKALNSDAKLCNVFYCDARQSQQKGKIEKNHEELRKIFPKGFDFNLINQEQLNLALNHVNNYPRPSLNNKTPYELFSVIAHPTLLLLNDSKKIHFKDLMLKPDLIKSKK